MFVKRDFNAGTAGIGRYKNYQLDWALEFLRGNVRVFEEHQEFGDDESFHLYVEPNLATLESIDTQPELKDPSSMRPFYDAANRPHGIFLGAYSKLADIEAGVHMIEPFFVDVLSDKGAENRILRAAETPNSYRLVPTNSETEESFTNALLTARDREVFVALKQGKNIPFEQMIGRVFRNLANALGVNYHIQQEKVDGAKKASAVTFTYEGLGGFRFEDKGEGQPVGLTRYSYGGNKQYGKGADYFVTFEGDATADNMQEKVFNWLIDAMMDVSPERLQSEHDYESFLKNRQRAADQFYGQLSEGSGKRQTSSGIVLKLV